MALKEEMPAVAAWVAEMRAAFCDIPEALAEFNANIVAGVRDGQPAFYASENGRTVGRKDERKGVMLTPPLKIAQQPDSAGKLTRYKA